MRKWIRLTIEILLGATVVGSGTFIYLQMTEISQLEVQVAKLNKSSAKSPPSDSSLSPIRLEQLIAKEKELEAVKSALSNGLALSDVEKAAKNAKNESPERYLAIGALRLLVKGKEDPETAKAFEKALEMNQWTERLKSVCAAQAGMVASGLQVDVLRDCDRIQQIENSIKSGNNSGVESGGANGNGTDENATEDSEGLGPTGV
ncbi:hypothetical protein N9V13_04210 [Betaproteobacteria bacterium]|nr:hypothetical protein [Betaproteobacteria bacterium]